MDPLSNEINVGSVAMVDQRTPSPIVPSNKSERTGSGGIMRRAVAEIARRYRGLSRDVLAVFDRIPVYAKND